RRAAGCAASGRAATASTSRAGRSVPCPDHTQRHRRSRPPGSPRYIQTVQLDVPLAPPDAFALDPAVVHLNHGSFGGCPRAVLAAQTRLRARVEAATMRYFVCEWQGDVDRARARVAGWLGGDPDGFVCVPNTTTAVSAVLGSLSFGPGDELLCTDHTYKACRNALERTARRTGAS